MLLKTSISNAKRFFQRTLQSFKTFLSGDYQRLPKSPPSNPISCTDMYNFTQNYKDKGKMKRNKKNKEEFYSGSLMIKKKYDQVLERRNEDGEEKKRLVYEGKRREGLLKSCSKGEEGIIRSCLVEKRLKELEMMDKGNIEHVLDIEEVLHYYSRLTCQAYVDIVDKFFMDMYAELSCLQGLPCADSSRSRIGSAKVVDSFPF